MTHEELLKHLWEKRNSLCDNLDVHFALSAVVELHKAFPYTNYRGQQIYFCNYCMDDEINNTDYPCPTIQAIEKELQ